MSRTQFRPQAGYSQNFALGTGVQVGYLGQRRANNIPYDNINPALNSVSGRSMITQQFARWLWPGKQRALYPHRKEEISRSTTSPLRQQVIATVTQVENVYWDLVNAYGRRAAQRAFAVLRPKDSF